MPNIFESNAATLQELDAAIKTAFKKRHEGDRQRQMWKDACRRFHESYDSLAFPGGLAKAIPALRAGNLTIIEMAVRFLEADPWFFRSGYIKAELIRSLCKAQLTDDQRSRLRQVILARIQGRDMREFRSYCHLARVVSDPSFEQKVSNLALSKSRVVSRHAEWVGAQLPRVPRKTIRKRKS